MRSGKRAFQTNDFTHISTTILLCVFCRKRKQSEKKQKQQTLWIQVIKLNQFDGKRD